jgi:bifunctional DNase/RNase
MVVVGVQVEAPANTPVVLLREDNDRGRVLPILIGQSEALAIHSAMEGIVPGRPLTHDLALTLVQTLGGTLRRVVVTHVQEHTFYAELHLTSASGAELVVSSRPSDAIALAVRCDAPVFAMEALLDEAALEGRVDEPDEETILDEFRDFLADVDPEDFAG